MEIPYTVTARPDTGLWNAKIGIWLFLASEVMLFGGLFSSYIFLRVGADYPWPVGVQKVPLGFTNTLVLILSSVTVVFAWASLKMRNYRNFQIYMSITLVCAFGFMVIKFFEYKGKLTHWSLRMNDGSVITGHLHHGDDDNIIFKDVSRLNLNAHSTDISYFLAFVSDSSGDAAPVKLTTEKGTEVSQRWLERQSEAITLLRSLERTTAQLEKDLAQATADKDESAKRKAEKGIASAAEHIAELEKEIEEKSGVITVSTSAPLRLSMSRRTPTSYTGEADGSEGSVLFRDGTMAYGSLESDSITMEVDALDLQAVNLKRVEGGAVENARVFHYLGDGVREAFVAHRDAVLSEARAKKGEEYPLERDAEVQRKALQLGLLDLADKITPPAEGDGTSEAGGEKGASEGGHGTVTVANEDVRFYSNFSPRLNTYYAIYFLLTGLHGLHVLGGIIVLGYFLVRGRQLYNKNPEHLANRVEVGGLFWHFVDLVWIFLFPLFYLLSNIPSAAYAH